MVRRAIDELRPTRGGDIWAATLARTEPLTEALSQELTDPNRRVVVGCVDDAVIGYGVVRLQGLIDGRVIGMVEDLYTEPEARGVGVGEAMMNLLVDWCREHRCTGIDALALPGNRATKNFFETFGLTARAIVVHRALDPEGAAESDQW
jgi:ribosomal protein S18 acetylase RimI-like enzyme